MRGVAGRYSPGAALTQIVPYSSSLYTVFHSVIYNSVAICSYSYIGISYDTRLFIAIGTHTYAFRMILGFLSL